MKVFEWGVAIWSIANVMKNEMNPKQMKKGCDFNWLILLYEFNALP